MAETRIVADGNSVTVWWALPNFAVNPANPTAAEINASLDVTRTVSFNDMSFGSQASDQISDPSLGDVGNVQSRGPSNYGGSLSFYYPANYTDVTNEAVDTFLALEEPGTVGYLIWRIDGEKTTSSAPDKFKPAVTGDFVNVYRVTSDGWTNVVAGDGGSYRYTIEFLNSGEQWVQARVGAVGTIAAPTAVGGSLTGTVGTKVPLSAFLASRTLYSEAGVQVGYPGAFRWVSSDPAVASVDRGGVLTMNAAGSATVSAIWPATGTASSTASVTVS